MNRPHLQFQRNTVSGFPGSRKVSCQLMLVAFLSSVWDKPLPITNLRHRRGAGMGRFIFSIWPAQMSFSAHSNACSSPADWKIRISLLSSHPKEHIRTRVPFVFSPPAPVPLCLGALLDADKHHYSYLPSVRLAVFPPNAGKLLSSWGLTLPPCRGLLAFICGADRLATLPVCPRGFNPPEVRLSVFLCPCQFFGPILIFPSHGDRG